MADEIQRLSAEELKSLREQLKNEAKRAVSTEPKKEEADEISKPKNPVGKRVFVKIAPDKMSASVILSAPKSGERYTVPEVITTLRKNRVVLGFQTQAIMDILADNKYDETVEVAVGKPVEPGTEGYYEYCVDLAVNHAPEIREDGSVDYSVMGKLPNVAAGDVIAIYHPAVQGKKGYNVVGAELLPKYAKDLPQLRGKHISFNEATNEYVAMISGKVSLKNNNVEILTVHEVQGDVDIAMGNVEFYGDVIIHGNVEAGVVIRAGRNVIIDGTVASARIFAGGDVTIAKGMQGKGRGRIAARGNIYADFLEYALVDCQGELFANSIINCQVNSNGLVHVEGTHGLVLGGKIHGLRGVVIKNCGNDTEPKTEIHAGFKQEDYQSFLSLMAEQKNCKKEAEDVIQTMNDLLVAARDQGVTEEEKKLVLELKQRKNEIYARLEKIDQEKRELGEKMTLGANANVAIKGDVYPNTYIAVDVAQIKIIKKESYTRFVCKNDMIERKRM